MLDNAGSRAELNLRTGLIAFGIVALVLLAFYWPLLSGQASFFYEDSSNAFEPLCTYIGKSLARFHLPLWNPYNYCGMSEIAVPAPSLFYPPNLLFALMPYNPAVSMILILSELVSFAGMYMLVRSLGWQRLAAVVAAVTVACGGYMFSFSNNYTLVATASWVPACFFFLREIESGRRPRLWCVALALGIAGLILAGRPEISGIAIAMIGGYAVLRAWRSGNWATLIEQVRAIFLGTLLSMPAIVPAMEWLPWSRRAGGLSADEVLQFSANWYDFICVAVSQPLGDLQVNAGHFRALVEPKNFPPYFGSAFVGPVALVLAALGLQRRGGWVYWSTIALLVVTAVLSLGQNVPGMRELVQAVPAMSAVRFPSKLMYFVALCLALLAARGLNDYLAGRVKLVIPFVVAGIILAAGAWLAASPPVVLPFLAGMPEPQVRAQGLIGMGTLLAGALALVAAFALWLGNRFDKRVHSAAVVAVLAAGSLTFHAFDKCRALAPGDFFLRPSYVADHVRSLAGADSDQRTMMLALEALSVPLPEFPEDPLPHTVTTYQYQRQLLKPFANVDYAVASPWGFDGPTSGEYSNFLMNMYIKSRQSLEALRVRGQGHSDDALYRLMQTTATRFVVSQCYRYLPGPTPVPPLDPRFFDLRSQDLARNIRIYELKAVLPRAYFTYRWQVRDRDQLITALTEPEKSGFDPGLFILLEQGTSGASQERPIKPLALTQVDAENVSIAVDCDAAGYVVLCDQFYPGWSATVDGKDVPILRCNGFMRAVEVAAGRHNVSFAYHPLSLYIGLLLAGIGVIWLIVLARGTCAPQLRSPVHPPN